MMIALLKCFVNRLTSANLHTAYLITLMLVGTLSWLTPHIAAAADPNAFITTWMTTENDERITIPIIEGGYNYSVDWGDGNTTGPHTGSVSHIYVVAGTYTVTITDTFPRIYFNNGGDRNKIISIEQWGNIVWSSMDSAFEGCTNLRYNATDAPDLSIVTNMREMFRNATVFNGAIGGWDVSNVKIMLRMFQEASSFDQNIGEWDISGVTNFVGMRDMFEGATLSTENYDALLVGWSTLEGEESIAPSLLFHAGDSQYCAAIAKTILTSTYSWNISDRGFADNCPRDPEAFITTWVTTENGESITIPTTGDGYDYTVDWGDGNANVNQPGNVAHTYAIAGTYTVSITGDFPRIYFNNNSGDRNKIFSIEQWGDISWSSMDSAFEGCTNLSYNADDNPILSQVTSMIEMFRGATVFNGNIGSWDTVRVEQMRDMFNGAAAFNQNISNWEVDNVTDMSNMFLNANTFNQNIGGWNVSSVTLMVEMFKDATAFNGNIGSWDTVRVEQMRDMFNGAAVFNQDISNWNVMNVLDMSFMFNRAETFNQDIGNWNVGNVRLMRNMFSGAEAFDQDIGNWNVSNVRVMIDMFKDVTLSTFNYDALLVGWSTIDIDADESALVVRVGFNGGNSKYCNTAARNILTSSPNLWTITDGGLDDDIACSVPYVANEIPDQHTTLGTDFRYTIPEDTFGDPNNDTLVYSAEIIPSTSWLSFTTSTLTFSGTPTNITDIGIITITVSVSDELGNGTNDIFTVTVLNRPPILEENRLETQIAVVGEPFEYRIPPDTFSDADIDFDDILTYTITIPMEVVDWLSFTTSTLTFSGIPTDTSYPDVITISITVTDLNNDSATGTLALVVQNQRDANQCFPKSRRRITGPLSEN